YDGPRKGLIGPWGHTYPDSGVPGAPINFVAESVRFWDHWLKGIDNGVMDEPMLRAFIREPTEHDASRADRPGRWISEPNWPTASVAAQRWLLDADGGLVAAGSAAAPASNGEPAASPHRLRGSQLNGLDAGTYMGFGLIEDLPGDQRREDGASLSCTTRPLEQPVTILGQAALQLDLAVDQPDALVAVRLCEITADGYSRLVARGLLNLTHRHSHEEPEPMVPGERASVSVDLSAAGYTFPAGSRIRVAVSPTYWPWAWPSPRPVTLEVYPGAGSTLSLPVRSPQPGDGEQPWFVDPARPGPAVPTGGGSRWYDHDQVSGRSELVTLSSKEVRIDDGLLLSESRRDAYGIIEDDPLSAEARSERSAQLTRGDWGVRIETVSTMTADATTFRLTNAIDAYEGATRVASRRWSHDIPRDHV
ncbi:MAG: CocE/NonD family hydrolase, partial [Actinomycetota bacterium]